MMFRRWMPILFVAMSGCSGSTALPTDTGGAIQRWYLIQLDHRPAGDDSARVAALGGREILPISLADGILLKTVGDGSEFEDVPGYKYRVAFSTIEPQSMVTLSFHEAIMESELALVTSLAERPPEVDSTGTSIDLFLPLKRINQLPNDPNILGAAVDPHVYFPLQ